MKHHPGRPIFSYMELLRQVSPWVNIVPLARNDFNLAKSNLAWLEGSAIGAATLAPKWEEWLRPGVVNYDGPHEFSNRLKGLLDKFGEQDQNSSVLHNVNDSRHCISEEHTLEHINRMRWEILNANLP